MKTLISLHRRPTDRREQGGPAQPGEGHGDGRQGPALGVDGVLADTDWRNRQKMRGQKGRRNEYEAKYQENPTHG